MKNFLLSLFLCTLLSGIFFATVPVYAQIADDITISKKPEYPKQGDIVVVSLDSTDINLDFEFITWYVNGSLITSGQAVTSVQIQTNTQTPTYVVRAVIGRGINPQSREITITTGNVVLLWEAVDSYVPSWYRGKPLAPREGTIRVTAIPVGANSLDRLFFLWKNGPRTLSDQSGFGKNSIILKKSLLTGDLPISVVASLPGNSGYTAEGSMSIPVSDPDIRFWSPRSVGAPSFEKSETLFLRDATVTVQAIPYFMQSRDGLRGLGYSWKLNTTDYQIPEGDNDNQIYIDQTTKTANLTIQSVYNLNEESSGSVQFFFQ